VGRRTGSQDADLIERAGDLKGELVSFALSPRFGRELEQLIEEQFPGGVVDDEQTFYLTVDYFALQYRLSAGNTVVEEFVTAHPDLPDSERDMLLGWRDVVEGMFEVTGKDRDAAVLVNVADELTYRTRSNMGARAFRPMKKGMILVGRVVPLGEDWLLSGNPALFPASDRDKMLAVAAQQATRHPELVFRNPARLAQARELLERQRATFVELFGSDLIVVPPDEVAAKVEEFYGVVTRQARADAGLGDEAAGEPPAGDLGLPDDIWYSGRVAVHFAEGEGLSFYPHYDLLEEVFDQPGLVARRRHRETLSEMLRDPETSPEPLRRLAARDPAKASVLFTRLLRRKRGFSWADDGEELLRQHKPSYYDGTRLPRTVVLPDPLTSALRRAQENEPAG